MSRNERIARIHAASNKLTTIINAGINASADIYAMLLDGVSIGKNSTVGGISSVIERNKKDFVSQLKHEIFVRCTQSNVVAEQSIGIPARSMGTRRLHSNAIIADGNDGPVNVRFDLADSTALDFFKFQSFSIAAIEGEIITEELRHIIRGRISDVIETGIPQKQFIDEILNAAGVGSVNQGHLNTVFRTNVATAQSASKLFALERNKKVFPGWEYIAILDNAVRPEHAALDGKYFRAGDYKYFPPIDFNCRCEGSPVDEIEFEDEGYAFEENDSDLPDVAEGFKNNAVQNFVGYVNQAARDNPKLKSILNDWE